MLSSESTIRIHNGWSTALGQTVRVHCVHACMVHLPEVDEPFT